MNPHSTAVCGFEKLTEDIDPGLVNARPALDEFGTRVKGSTPTIDLDEEIGRPEPTCAIQQWLNSRRVIEDAVAALGEDPEPASGGAFGRCFGLDFGWRARKGFVCGSSPSGEFIRRTGYQTGGKHNRQADKGPIGSSLNRRDTQNAHTVTSRALRLNGGHYKDDVILGAQQRIIVESSPSHGRTG